MFKLGNNNPLSLPTQNKGWAHLKSEKEIVTNFFIAIYENDLKRQIDDKSAPREELKDLRLIQKHIGLALLRSACNQDELWILPIGRMCKDGIDIPGLITSQYHNYSTEDSISRLDSFIVYEPRTGGMCLFHFGSNYCTLEQSYQQLMDSYPELYSQTQEKELDFERIHQTSAYRLCDRILQAAIKGLSSDQIHAQYYENFNALTHNNLTARSTQIIQQTLSHLDRIFDALKQDNSVIIRSENLSAGYVIGCAPLVPATLKLVLGRMKNNTITLHPAAFESQSIPRALKEIVAPSAHERVAELLQSQKDHPAFSAEIKKPQRVADEKEGSKEIPSYRFGD